MEIETDINKPYALRSERQQLIGCRPPGSSPRRRRSPLPADRRPTRSNRTVGSVLVYCKLALIRRTIIPSKRFVLLAASGVT